MNRIHAAVLALLAVAAVFLDAEAIAASRAECVGYGGTKICTEPDMGLVGDYIGWGQNAIFSSTACSVIGTDYDKPKNNGQETYVIVLESGSPPAFNSYSSPLVGSKLVNYCTFSPHKPNSRGYWPAVFQVNAKCTSGALNNSIFPSLCIPSDVIAEKNNGPSCPSSGNPINSATGNKYQQEVDYQSASGLIFVRTYNSSQSVNTASSLPGEIGINWRHSYKRSLSISKVSALIATVYREDGRAVRFVLTGDQWKAEADSASRLRQTKDAAGAATGWEYLNAVDDSTELYDVSGRLLKSTARNGQTMTFAYSDASTPGTVATKPGLLISVTDAFGRQLRFSYDEKARITKLINPSGGEYLYGYDEQTAIAPNNTRPGNLTSVTYPDGKKRLYWYNEQDKTGNADISTALTGITDENGVRFATYRYDSSQRAVSTEHAGGVNKYTVSYDTPFVKSTVTDPLGSKRTFGLVATHGVVKSGGQSQPGGAGCGPASSAITYDANGNVSSQTDFNGIKTNYGYDLTRNLETTRVEAVGTPQARTITTEWHPDFRLPTRVAGPKHITTNTYDGNGNLTEKRIQATSDANGAQGFAASSVGSAQVWSYTYNDVGQVLSAIDPRDNTNTYIYDNQGNLTSVSNAVGHVTTLTNYDAHGRIGRIVDPNGLTTDLSYSSRGWLTSKKTGEEMTRYDYDGVGQLTKATLPDGSHVTYTYDDAHRLTAIVDSLGNSIAYTLDPMGNRVSEQVRDPEGALTRQTTRVYDALSRLQQVTGAIQ
jgi:YD repeat-containing protein